MHRNKSVSVHQFAMVPRADIPRSGFKIESGYKTTFDAGWLIPVYVEEVLPGDSFSLKATMFARLATPIVPVMDNLYLDSFYFFVPNRLVWDNWQRFMGERDNPGDSIDYVVPYISNPAGGFAEGSIYDYMGVPPGVGTAADAFRINALPLRAYYAIWKEWFRDQNLQAGGTVPKSDGPDLDTSYSLLRRGKRHDYFTSCLPWVQKGTSVPLPLGTTAPVISDGNFGAPTFRQSDGTGRGQLYAAANAQSAAYFNTTGANSAVTWGATIGLVADLSAATAATINQIRQAFQVQKLLERDARGGTRYTEILRSHFGVVSPDGRLQRPEYLGGSSTPINISPVAQTSGTAGTGGYTNTPQGNLSAVGTALSRNGFTQSFTEHGYVIGLVSVRADLNYQQGLSKLWSRSTRYDFYWPVFANLGEQAVLNREIYLQGSSADTAVFGYQERWAEYRYKPSLVTSMLRSSAAQPLDIWHLSQDFGALPTLNSTFIEENPPIERIIATTEQTGQQFVMDCFFQNKVARPLPMYSVPGLVDHF